VEKRRDPEEEFFMLAVLSHKMNHNENSDDDFLYEIDSQSLFKEVKANALPFHKWFGWIGERFLKIKEEKATQEETQMTELQRWEEEQERLREEQSNRDKPKNSGAMGIFDKIYKYINRETKEDREERERKELARDMRLLYGTSDPPLVPEEPVSKSKTPRQNLDYI
jgi:signal transduction histidine kinase